MLVLHDAHPASGPLQASAKAAPLSSTERAMACRRRRYALGWRMPNVLIPPEAMAALRAACKRERCTQADYLTRLILRNDTVI